MSADIDRREFVSLLVGGALAGVSANGREAEEVSANDFAAVVELLGLGETEWSMGNGQCWECFGLGPIFKKRDSLGRADEGRGGHEPWCRTAAILQAAGREVEWKTRDVRPEPSPEERRARLRRNGR